MFFYTIDKKTGKSKIIKDFQQLDNLKSSNVESQYSWDKNTKKFTKKKVDCQQLINENKVTTFKEFIARNVIPYNDTKAVYGDFTTLQNETIHTANAKADSYATIAAAKKTAEIKATKKKLQQLDEQIKQNKTASASETSVNDKSIKE